jgi:hypothetical protein
MARAGGKPSTTWIRLGEALKGAARHIGSLKLGPERTRQSLKDGRVRSRGRNETGDTVDIDPIEFWSRVTRIDRGETVVASVFKNLGDDPLPDTLRLEWVVMYDVEVAAEDLVREGLLPQSALYPPSSFRERVERLIEAAEGILGLRKGIPRFGGADAQAGRVRAKNWLYEARERFPQGHLSEAEYIDELTGKAKEEGFGWPRATIEREFYREKRGK